MVSDTLQISSSTNLVRDSFAGTFRIRPLRGVEIADVRKRAARSTFMSKRRLTKLLAPLPHVGRKQLAKHNAK